MYSFRNLECSNPVNVIFLLFSFDAKFFPDIFTVGDLKSWKSLAYMILFSCSYSAIVVVAGIERVEVMRFVLFAKAVRL